MRINFIACCMAGIISSSIMIIGLLIYVSHETTTDKATQIFGNCMINRHSQQQTQIYYNFHIYQLIQWSAVFYPQYPTRLANGSGTACTLTSKLVTIIPANITHNISCWYTKTLHRGVNTNKYLTAGNATTFSNIYRTPMQKNYQHNMQHWYPVLSGPIMIFAVAICGLAYGLWQHCHVEPEYPYNILQ